LGGESSTAHSKENYLLMTCREDSAIKQVQFLLFGCWFVVLGFFLILSLNSDEIMYQSDSIDIIIE